MNVRKGVLVTAVIIIAQSLLGCAQHRAVEVFRTRGDVSQYQSGWTYEASPGTETVYIPFEGFYPDKGGRMQSPVFALPDSGGWGSYYRLTFTARSAEHCYWWLDYFDKDGLLIPDNNSKVYPGPEFRDYDEMVYVPGEARSAQIAFVSKGKVEARNVRFATATAAEAAKWCDDLYSTIPPLNFTVPGRSMARLPRTVAAMKNGTPWRVVMLGNSIMNDSFNSLFMALVQRDFPKARFNVVSSVRGGTRSDYYRKPEAFAKYVAAHKPDLLMILDGMGGEDVEAVATMARDQVGCEVIIMNGGLTGDWRERNSTLDWRSLKGEVGHEDFDVAPLRRSAQKVEVAFWDLVTPCQDYLASIGYLDFGRDWVHNNDVGKQIIGRTLHQFFLTANQE